jgi:hypothetical protein
LDPEDAQRMDEAGFIQSDPDQSADGMDWRFLEN